MEDFINYIQKYPKLYAIAKSPLCIQLLNILSKSGKTLKEIKKNDLFHNIDLKDLEELLDVLIKIKLLKKIKTGAITIFYSSKYAEQFLKEYKNTESKYSI